MKNELNSKQESIWQKARLIDKSTFENAKVRASDDEFRLDDSGAIIKYSDFGIQSEYGWTIDHILPISKGGTDHTCKSSHLFTKSNK